MTLHATLAVYAAKHAHIWGHDAARSFALTRGVSPRLYRIARQCESTGFRVAMLYNQAM